MKRRLMIMVVWLTAMVAAHAQQGLNVAPLFDGKIVPRERVVETRVKGRSLSKYQLTFFRSLRFVATEEERRQVRRLVEKDLHQAGKCNFQSQKSHSQETLMIQLPSQGGQNRFLCYKNWEKKMVTVVYMEGPLSSLESLKSILK